MRASGSRTETSSSAACPGQQGGSVDNSAETSLTMGTQGPGRKRIPNRDKLTAEDDALNQIAREAEARLAAKRAARAEAREIRMKELEKQQKEVRGRWWSMSCDWLLFNQWLDECVPVSRIDRRAD
ncbi:leucine-rich repeat flightless-interacting protein 2-like [Leuresthes tenuis]|uniref:leucine-rich repeat flightless-interacting protein 2-like n=1 Tax=Leuresthes tenuis TaxID=355514 RepID=UPI003B511FC6